MFLQPYCEGHAFKGAIEHGDNLKTDSEEAWVLDQRAFSYVGIVMWGTCLCFPTSFCWDMRKMMQGMPNLFIFR